MIAVLIALIVALAPVSTPVNDMVRDSASVSQMELSAWESYEIVFADSEPLENSTVSYSRSADVREGFKVNVDEFHVIDPYDSMIAHVFKVSPVYHA